MSTEISIKNSTAPSTPTSGYTNIYVDTADKHLKTKDDAGTIVDLTDSSPTVTANRAVVSDGSGAITAATTTATEIGYVNGVTSAIQTQLDAKQPLDTELTALAGLTSAADKGIQFTGSGTAGTYDLTTAGKALLDDADATAQRATLGLTIGTNVQAYDAELAAIAGLTSAADKGIQFTGAGTAATFDLTAAGKALLDDADNSAQRTTLGLGTIATQAANNVSISGGSITGITDLAVADGGTGASTHTANGVLLGNTTSAITATAAGTTGTVLKGNTSSAPTFGAVSLTADVSGILPVANGGTGTSTALTAGSVVFAGASGVYTQDNANFYYDTTTDFLGLGVAPTDGRLHILCGAQRAINANGTDSTVDSNKLVDLQLEKTNSSASDNATCLQAVANSSGTASVAFLTGAAIEANAYTVGEYIVGVNASADAQDDAVEVYGGLFESSASGDIDNVFGINTVVNAGGVAAVAVYGDYALVTNSGTAPDVYGYNGYVRNFDTITRAHGLYSKVSNFAGTIGTAYGLYISDVEGTATYSIYASDTTATSFFGGPVTINKILKLTQADDGGTGNVDAFDASAKSSFRLTGAMTALRGITSGSDGRVITFSNVSGGNITISNLHGTPTAANTIITGTGGDVTFANNKTVMMIYDATSSRWRMIGTL